MTYNKIMKMSYKGCKVEICENVDGTLVLISGKYKQITKAKTFEEATNEARLWLLELEIYDV